MAHKDDSSVRLTGGTFFVLLTRAMKTPTRKSSTKNKSFGEDAGGITEPELMKGLIRVCGIKDPVFPAKGSKLTEYKQCKISANVYMPFDEDQFVETFDLSVKGNYQKPLSEMAKVVDRFIDFENDSKRDRLVRSLLEVLKKDKTIDNKTEIYVRPDGSKVTVESLDSESVLYIESVLLGIWHYIITNVKDNEAGKETYNSWHRRDGEKGASHTFVGTVGSNTERSIKVLRAKNVKAPVPEKAFEEFTKELEIYDAYLRAITERYDTIKTLLYKEHTVPFYDLYVCNNVGVKKVETEDGENRVIEGYIEDIDVTVFDEFARHIVITGMGGLGKSMMLRHLLLNAAMNYKPGARIPIFVQLKEYDDDKKLVIDFIYESLNSHGVKIERDVFESDLAKGKYLLLFDGLDEIGATRRGIFENKLSRFVDAYSRNAVCVSSRPYSEFVNLHFTIARLMPFRKNQAVELIQKLKFEPVEVKNKFLDELKRKLFNTHRHFTENPLLLTLMLMTYREHMDFTGQEQMHYFYGEAYEVLATRHDAYKESPVRRPLSTGLSKERFAEYFAEFCAHSYTDEKRNFTEEELEEYFEALKILDSDRKENGLVIKSKDFIDDVKNNLCIMFEADGKYHFIHNSFQEYFCAKFFATRVNDEDYHKIGQFFEADRKKSGSFYADHTLDMLYEMRREKVERFILTPFLEKLLDNCERQEGYRTFLKKVYPKILYFSGNMDFLLITGPKSYLAGFILLANGSNAIFRAVDLPYHKDFVIEEYGLAENPETGALEPVPIKVLKKDKEYCKVNGTPVVSCVKVEIDTEKLLDNERKYKEIIAAIEDKTFLYYLQYEELKSILNTMKERYAEGKSKSGISSLFE